MKKSREFDNVLDECLERLLVKGEPIAQCLQSFPKQADELKPLLETALATRKASAIQPRPEFRDKARYQFSSALQERELKSSRSFFSWGWQSRWVPVMAIVLTLLLAGGGTVAAASSSMPDELLYPVKLASEQMRLVFTPSALGKAEFYAGLADRRVAEIVHLADKNKPEQIEQTAQRLNTYLTKIVDLTSTQPVTGGVAMPPAAKEQPLPPEQAVGLKAVNVTAAPPVEKAPLPPEQAVGAKAAEESNISVGRRARLRATVESYAIDHPARLRALLPTAPQSARPALLRAIEVSETGYEKALKSLDQP